MTKEIETLRNTKFKKEIGKRNIVKLLVTYKIRSLLRVVDTIILYSFLGLGILLI